MKFKFIFVIAAMFWLVPASAQSLKKPFSIGFGIEGGPTLGATRTLYKGLVGFNAWVSFRAGQGFFTAGTGYIPFMPNKDNQPFPQGHQIPFLAGYKYVFLQQHVFVKMETGLSQFTRTYSHTEIAPLRSFGLTLAPSAGIQLNAMELSVKYEVFPTPGLLVNYWAVQLGFNF